MARPRQFDEDAVLDAAMQRFWSRGYEVTSVRELAEGMGLTSASLYNAFGDKLGLYRRSLQHYLDRSVRDRIARACGPRWPRSSQRRSPIDLQGRDRSPGTASAASKNHQERKQA